MGMASGHPGLASSFLHAYRGAAAAVDGPRERLEASLHELWERGRVAWPGVALAAPALAAYLGERAPSDAALSAWLDEVRAADMFLACACALGLAPAIRAFDATFLVRTNLYLRSLRPTRELVAETRQELLLSLFVDAPGRPPKIRGYRGRGPLDRWVGVAALRTALDLMRRQKWRERGGDEDLLERSDGPIAAALAHVRDPELALVRARCQDDFVAAFRDAMSSLTPRERTLLRLAFLEGLTPAKIGVVYGVHRTTAMRWIEATQEAVLARTRSGLMGRLRLSSSECDRVLAVMQSDIPWSLASLLRETG